MKKTIAVLIAVLILFCPIHIAAQINAEAYVLTDAGSGKILSSKNENERHEPASTTKILTALVALENTSLDSIFTVSEKAAEIEGSGIGIEAGEKISFEDLLYMLLLKSGNDAAVTIAENGDIAVVAGAKDGETKEFQFGDVTFTKAGTAISGSSFSISTT